ncbi:hypothetical protein V6N13_132932 [Hibiscus sabdariffa]
MSFSSSHGSVKNKSREVECYCRVKAPVCVSNTGKNLDIVLWLWKGEKSNFFEWVDLSEFSEIQSENEDEEMEEEKQNLLYEIKGIKNEIACLKENGSVEEIN